MFQTYLSNSTYSTFKQIKLSKPTQSCKLNILIQIPAIFVQLSTKRLTGKPGHLFCVQSRTGKINQVIIVTTVLCEESGAGDSYERSLR